MSQWYDNENMTSEGTYMAQSCHFQCEVSVQGLVFETDTENRKENENRVQEGVRTQPQSNMASMLLVVGCHLNGSECATKRPDPDQEDRVLQRRMFR